MGDILEKIVAKRREDLKRFGATLGVCLPASRGREVVPFLQNSGVILEVKRASPSRGDIAPDLDAAATAKTYAKCGAAAISTLTERHFFKGGLEDLLAVCAAVDEVAGSNLVLTNSPKPAVLRKDFLIAPEEIDAAFLAGADAVLLIARILDEELLLKMASKAGELGLGVLFEVREKADLQKLAFLNKKLSLKNFVCGVNCRDLATFEVDLLAPLRVKNEINLLNSNLKIVFESGVKTPSAAAFAKGCGFEGLLLGEAAASNPQNAAAFVEAFKEARENSACLKWGEFVAKEQSLKTSQRAYNTQKAAFKKSAPFVKICGVTNEEDAIFCAQNGADFLGFVLAKNSPRRADLEFVKRVRAVLSKSNLTPTLVGVVTDEAQAKEAAGLVESGAIDLVQFHGFAPPEFTQQKPPCFCAVNLASQEDLAVLASRFNAGEPRVLLDSGAAKSGGSGVRVEKGLVKEAAKLAPLWLSGGINEQNVAELVAEFSPELIDASSGLEAEVGRKSRQKVAEFFAALREL